MAAITIAEIRTFLNDTPESNRVLRKVEFNSERIQQAINYVVSDWNETPPLVANYTVDTFPYKTALLYGVVSFLLKSESISQERNHLGYQSGGLSIDDSNHSGAYTQLANYFEQQYKNQIERLKKVENWNLAYSTIGSGWYA